MKRLLSTILAVLMVLALALPAAAQAPDGATPPLRTQKGDKSSFVSSSWALPPSPPMTAASRAMPATKPGKGGRSTPTAPTSRSMRSSWKRARRRSASRSAPAQSNKIYEYTFALNGFAAQLTPVQAEEMARQPGVALVTAGPRCATRQTDSSPTFLGLTAPAARGPGATRVRMSWSASSTPASGRSIPALPMTAPTARRRRAGRHRAFTCEFGNTAHNPNDAPFTCNNKLHRRPPDARHLSRADRRRCLTSSTRRATTTATARTPPRPRRAMPASQATIYGIPRGTVSGIAPRAHE